MKTGKYLYTVVCRYITVNGIIELDMYEVFKRLHMKPTFNSSFGISWRHHDLIRYHVYTGQAVEYVIKRVLRNIDITDETKHFYTEHSPYSILYDCRYDLKDVERMNMEKVFIRRDMSDKDFYRVYGGKNL